MSCCSRILLAAVVLLASMSCGSAVLRAPFQMTGLTTGQIGKVMQPAAVGGGPGSLRIASGTGAHANSTQLLMDMLALHDGSAPPPPQPRRILRVELAKPAHLRG
uniref:Uncharacterized protein n=1 Tax=Hemiselmis tepida TaxID=464990 RepID=A0A7S0YLK5_9CRYP|mmetsp:Transcript_14287/g.36486  ORF Transcript_14287/g.36486 Transcript_14287/m.36486 type:complete len:105 (+) Transcript_14287:53-367(+)